MSKIIEIYKFSKHSVSTGKLVSVSDPRSWWAEISNQTFEIFYEIHKLYLYMWFV